MKSDKYVVGKKVGETEEFRIYKCRLSDTEVGILKIALSIAENSILDREAFILKSLREEAELCEVEYQKRNPGRVLNYKICFPELVDSFIAEDQGGRRINILKFPYVCDDVGRLVPIGQIASPLHLHARVDPRTSAWILGKGLKLLNFAHNQGMLVGRIDSENFLIECDEHYVAFFDWSNRRTEFTKEAMCEEISQLAQEVISALGGNPETFEIPSDPQDSDGRYQAMLSALANGKYFDAQKAHADFYKLVRSLWPREFWEFTTYSLERAN